MAKQCTLETQGYLLSKDVPFTGYTFCPKLLEQDINFLRKILKQVIFC